MERTHSFGYWLKRRRKALDLTQAALAKQVSCSLDLIQKIEADARRPSRQLAEKLADCLGLVAEERAAFVEAARAERAADQLTLPDQPVEPAGAALPQGTITFLFTDIEGSTQLWERHPQAMPAALSRHDALLREKVGAHGGAVFKMVGDGVHAAFAQAPDALAAALAIQRGLATEPWPLPEPPRVRLALHSGGAESRDGDYFGPALNRTARLLQAGHGGQVLLSLATEQLVREHLPPDVSLRDLGIHGLKDLSLPEQIFQLAAPDLPATFPTLNTLDARRTNLPAQLTPLVGREQEVAAVSTLLRQTGARLVSLTGPGGVGKTRLGLQVAADLIEDFADGAYFVDLAPIRDPSLVSSAIAQTLGVHERAGQPLLERLKGELRYKRMLLLLDNFEQLLDGAAQIAELLAAAARLTILVTSREQLHLRGEQEVAVQPLALPDPTQLPPLEQLSQYAAVALFIQRAQASQPAFQVTNANAPAVAEICARLDGLPLAIELAAARVKLFAPQALLARLSGRLVLLSGGARDLPARQQTIRDTIAWSYDLLNQAEQTLFRRLGVFVGGCTFEAVEAICLEGKSPKGKGKNEDNDATLLPFTFLLLPSLAALVDKSLLRQTTSPEGTVRLVMLETIREYALELLEGSGEAEPLRRQHAAYYLARAEELDSIDDLEFDAWLLQIDPEYDNLRAALAWSQTPAGDPEVALRLGDPLGSLWYHRGVRREQLEALERSLAHPLGIGRTNAHANARLNLGTLLVFAGKYAAARSQYEQALQLVHELEDTEKYGITLERLGWLAREQGDSATAWARLAESLAIFRRLEQPYWIAQLLNTMAGVAILDGDPPRAEALLAESREVAKQLGPNCILLAWTLNHRGHVAQLRGDYDRAAQLHHESLDQFSSDYHSGLLWAYHGLGETYLGLQRLDKAADWLARGLALSHQLDDMSTLGWFLAGLGTVAALSGQVERAAGLWGAAERLQQSIGCRPAPATRATYEHALADARTQLGEAAFALAWAAGRALTLEQAIAYGLPTES